MSTSAGDGLAVPARSALRSPTAAVPVAAMPSPVVAVAVAAPAVVAPAVTDFLGLQAIGLFLRGHGGLRRILRRLWIVEERLRHQRRGLGRCGKDRASSDDTERYPEKFPPFHCSLSFSWADADKVCLPAKRALSGNCVRRGMQVRRRSFCSCAATVRGSFRFNHHHFPIQNFYLQEVIKDETGEFTMKNLGMVSKDSADPYADKCNMKW